MSDLRFQLCKVTEDCPACLEVDVATFPMASAHLLFQVERATIARLQFVRGEISGKGKPLSYLDPELLLDIFLQPPVGPSSMLGLRYFELKLSWVSALLGAGNFKIYLYAKAGTVVTGRLLVP